MNDSRAEVFNTMCDTVDTLYKRLHGNSSSLEDFDESFNSVSSFRNPGYIAMLQKQLAASGTCLITVGGGSFQKTTIKLYKKYHPGNSSCAVTIELPEPNNGPCGVEQKRKKPSVQKTRFGNMKSVLRKPNNIKTLQRKASDTMKYSKTVLRKPDNIKTLQRRADTSLPRKGLVVRRIHAA